MLGSKQAHNYTSFELLVFRDRISCTGGCLIYSKLSSDDASLGLCSLTMLQKSQKDAYFEPQGKDLNTLGIQVAQSRYHLHTLGPKAGSISKLVSL